MLGRGLAQPATGKSDCGQPVVASELQSAGQTPGPTKSSLQRARRQSSKQVCDFGPSISSATPEIDRNCSTRTLSSTPALSGVQSSLPTASTHIRSGSVTSAHCGCAATSAPHNSASHMGFELFSRRGTLVLTNLFFSLLAAAVLFARAAGIESKTLGLGALKIFLHFVDCDVECNHESPFDVSVAQR